MSTRLPPLRALGCFETSARLGSFTVAADELCLTPSAVSHQIRLLEEHLGFLLFTRVGRKMVLTEAGRAYYEIVRSPLKSISDAKHRLKILGQKDTLCVKCPGDFASAWLMPRITSFIEHHPDIRLTILTGDKDALKFDDDEPDAEIRYGHGKWPTSTAIHLMQDCLLPVCSPGLLERKSINDPADVLSHHLLYTGSRSVDWHAWADHYGVEGIDSALSTRIDRSSLVREAAVLGVGLALESRICAERTIATGTLIAPLPEHTYNEGSYYYTYSKSAGESSQSSAFKEWLLTEFARYKASKEFTAIKPLDVRAAH
ncbi:LysR substrate-binding domain-containing protein [Mesorhizobium sp.]|uniref:LysR substrate-binding domain-containing protein n=1 Tax=Mesorhizobium sp. TaxID=1871066 RepID=UPI000FE7D6F7|nr:LysR substrate-binding domain-containing protein [Mesorhizobium sp.]RWJ05721.1 MAG: LysR family transcriptional regulator [Mesorhizobium sp.]